MLDFQRATYEILPVALAGDEYAFPAEWGEPVLGDDEVLAFSVYWRPASTGEAQWLHDAESPAGAFDWLGHEALRELNSWRFTVTRRHRGAFSPDLLDTLTGDFLTLAGACALTVIALGD